MTPGEARRHHGEEVIYRPQGAPAESGVITGVGLPPRQVVFVPFGAGEHSKATRAGDLELAHPMDIFSWYVATMHQLLGHDKAALAMGQDPAPGERCLLCEYEEDPSPERRRAVVAAMSEAADDQEESDEQG